MSRSFLSHDCCADFSCNLWRLFFFLKVFLVWEAYLHESRKGGDNDIKVTFGIHTWSILLEKRFLSVCWTLKIGLCLEQSFKPLACPSVKPCARSTKCSGFSWWRGPAELTFRCSAEGHKLYFQHLHVSANTLSPIMRAKQMKETSALRLIIPHRHTHTVHTNKTPYSVSLQSFGLVWSLAYGGKYCQYLYSYCYICCLHYDASLLGSFYSTFYFSLNHHLWIQQLLFGRKCA